jgi:hypothetical protein
MLLVALALLVASPLLAKLIGRRINAQLDQHYAAEAQRYWQQRQAATNPTK